MSADGNTSWFADASDFHVNHGKIVHHGHPQGTRENVSYYPRAKGFSFDTLDITHFTNGGMPPPPRPPPSGLGGSSSSSSSGFPPGSTRPKKPRSTTQDSRSTAQGWFEDYGKGNIPDAYDRPGAAPLQHQAQSSHTFPSRGMSTPSSFQPGFYGSYAPYSTLPAIAVQSPQTSAANDLQDRDRHHSFNPRDDQEEEVQSNPDDDEWQISDDEEVEEPEPHAGYMMNHVYIPRLLEWMATQHPSYWPSRTELLNLWEEYVPETPLHGGLQTHIITSAGDRIRAWRDGFLAQALEYLERHVRPRLESGDPEVRQRWAQSMKPSGRKRPPYPFYFKDPEKRAGSFLSDFIAFTMSSHLRAISVMPQARRSPAFPLGALALTLQACESVVDEWASEAHHPSDYTLRGSTFPEDVWQLVTTQLSDRGLKQRRILEAATQWLGSSTTL